MGCIPAKILMLHRAASSLPSNADPPQQQMCMTQVAAVRVLVITRLRWSRAKTLATSLAGGGDVPRPGAAPLTQHWGAAQRVVTVNRDHRTHPCVRTMLITALSDNRSTAVPLGSIAAAALPNPAAPVPAIHRTPYRGYAL